MTVNRAMLAAQIALLLPFFAVPLFLAAGTIAWSAGWIFLALFFIFVIALTLWLLRHNPALLKERMTNFQPDQAAWDKVFFILANVVFVAWLVLMPLDAVRFQWSRMPGWLQALGGIILLASFALFFLTFRENSYLSPMVRIQEERGQTVVATGPYHYVRHPMYAAFLLYMIGTTVLLGSWYGLLLGLLLVGMVARRAVLEERTLRAALPGYDDYLTRVTYRLIPHVW